MNLKTATPAEIDTALAAIYERAATPEHNLAYARERLNTILRALLSGERTHWTEDSRVKADAAVTKYAAEYAAIMAECDPYDAQFNARGGWTRAFLVLNTGGHIHSSMNCATCFATTRFGWLPQVSGATEAEIVGQAGEGACTVCWPTAPVDVLKRTRTLLHSSEETAAVARQARADKKAAAAAKKAEKAITAPDGTALRIFKYTREARIVVTHRGEKTYPAFDIYDTIETAMAAKGWLTDHFQHLSFGWSGETAEAVQQVSEALAAKFGSTVEAEVAAAKVRAGKRK